MGMALAHCPHYDGSHDFDTGILPGLTFDLALAGIIP